MEDLKFVVSKNLVRLRQHAKLTQLELAQKLQYSDKSISKWERGEGLPDLEVLVKLSKIYGVSLNAFVEKDEKKVVPKKLKASSHTMISLLSAGLVFFVASIIFAVLYMIPSTKNISWMSFIYAVPLSAIVLLVLSIKWKNLLSQAIFCSVILWGLILSVCISISYSDIWSICVMGFILELLIIFWFILRKINIVQKIANLKKKFSEKKSDN